MNIMATQKKKSKNKSSVLTCNRKPEKVNLLIDIISKANGQRIPWERIITVIVNYEWDVSWYTNSVFRIQIILLVFKVEKTKNHMPRRGDIPVSSNARAAPQLSNKNPSKG